MAVFQWYKIILTMMTTLMLAPQTQTTTTGNVCNAVTIASCTCSHGPDLPDIICKSGTNGWPSKLFNATQISSKKIPIGVLELSGNDLSTLRPNFFSQVRSVKTVKLQKCNLSNLPKALFKIKNIQVLDLSSNSFHYFPLDSVTSFNLYELSLKNNDLREISINGTLLTSLKILDVSLNRLREFPLILWQTLHKVNISHNLFSKMPMLPDVSKLKHLDASANLIMSLPVEFLAKCQQLQTLNLARNKIQTAREELDVNASLTQLLELDLSQNNTDELGHIFTAQLSQLTLLDLSGNQLTHLSHNSFSPRTSHLQHLNLSSNFLKSLHQATFSHLQHLEILDISNNPQLGSAGLNHVVYPDHLVSLDISNCSLDQVNYCQLSRLHDMSFLELHNNRLHCTCDLNLLQKWYRNLDQANKSQSNNDASWQCFSRNARSTASAGVKACPDHDCPSVDPNVQQFSEIKISLNVVMVKHHLITSWTVSNNSHQIHGFRVVCLHKGEETQDHLEHAAHVSPILDVALRSYTLIDVQLENGYTVCVDVLRNDMSVMKRVCKTVQGEKSNILVGILAGTIFLFPCIIFIIYISFKDRQISKRLSYIEIAYHKESNLPGIGHSDHGEESGEQKCYIQDGEESGEQKCYIQDGEKSSDKKCYIQDGKCSAKNCPNLYSSDSESSSHRIYFTRNNVSQTDSSHEQDSNWIALSHATVNLELTKVPQAFSKDEAYCQQNDQCESDEDSALLQEGKDSVRNMSSRKQTPCTTSVIMSVMDKVDNTYAPQRPFTCAASKQEEWEEII